MRGKLLFMAIALLFLLHFRLFVLDLQVNALGERVAAAEKSCGP